MSEKLQYRLYNASIIPPDNAWPSIAAQLDADAHQQLSRKMQEATLAPPAHVWDNIQSMLDDTRSAAVVAPMRRGWKGMAVAAGTAGIIILSGLFYYFFTRDNTSDRLITTTPSSQQTPSRPGQAIQPKDNATPRASGISPAVTAARPANPAGNTRYGLTGNSNQPPVRYAHTDMGTMQAWGPDDLDLNEVIDEPLQALAVTHITPKKYLTVPAPNGQAVKVSAKLTDAMDCVLLDEPPRDMNMALRNVLWKMRISNWSNKLVSASGFIPSASNFFDIITLEELLKE